MSWVLQFYLNETISSTVIQSLIPKTHTWVYVGQIE